MARGAAGAGAGVAGKASGAARARAGACAGQPVSPAESLVADPWEHSMSSPLEGTLQRSLGRSVMGLVPLVRALTIALVARGHVLIQGVPGLGKTLLSKSLAAALGGNFRRIQGTSDLMPSDIIGVHVYDTSHQQFVFHPGPLFADVLLFDEINRTGPKTQSALLEAMEERQVSVDRHLY